MWTCALPCACHILRLRCRALPVKAVYDNGGSCSGGDARFSTVTPLANSSCHFSSPFFFYRIRYRIWEFYRSLPEKLVSVFRLLSLRNFVDSYFAVPFIISIRALYCQEFSQHTDSVVKMRLNALSLQPDSTRMVRSRAHKVASIVQYFVQVGF